MNSNKTLAAIDEAIAYGLGTEDRASRVKEARAAVAELIEAANDYANADAPASIMDERRQRLRAALSRIGGAK